MDWQITQVNKTIVFSLQNWLLIFKKSMQSLLHYLVVCMKILIWQHYDLEK